MENSSPVQPNVSKPLSLKQRFGTMSQEWTIDTTKITTGPSNQDRLKKFGPGYKTMLETLFNEWNIETNNDNKKTLASQIIALVFVLYYKTRARVEDKPNENNMIKNVQSALKDSNGNKYFLTVWYDSKGKCNFIIPDKYWDKIFVNLSTIFVSTLIEASQLMPSTLVLYNNCYQLFENFQSVYFYEFPTTINIEGLDLLITNQGEPVLTEIDMQGQDILLKYKKFFAKFWNLSFFNSCKKAIGALHSKSKFRTDYYSNEEDFIACVKAERGSTCKGVFGSITSNLFSRSKGGKTHRKHKKRSKNRKTKKTKTKRYRK